MQLSLYVHFPFCKQKCLYCDFCSAPQSESMIRAYCTALIAEIRHEAEAFAGTKVSTVFFGGGTPSVVPADCMAEVLTVLRESFDFLPDVEFTS